MNLLLIYLRNKKLNFKKISLKIIIKSLKRMKMLRSIIKSRKSPEKKIINQRKK
jgi:hypothetical protein